MSIIYFYKRIFSINRRSRWTLYGIEGFITIWTLARFLGDTFQCTPVSYFWDKVQKGHCVHQVAMYIANQVINIASDLMLYLYPIPIIWKLQVDAARKFGLSLIFVAGALYVNTLLESHLFRG